MYSYVEDWRYQVKDNLSVLKMAMASALADYLGFTRYRTLGKSISQVEDAGWVWNDERLAWINPSLMAEGNAIKEQ